MRNCACADSQTLCRGVRKKVRPEKSSSTEKVELFSGRTFLLLRRWDFLFITPKLYVRQKWQTYQCKACTEWDTIVMFGNITNNCFGVSNIILFLLQLDHCSHSNSAGHYCGKNIGLMEDLLILMSCLVAILISTLTSLLARNILAIIKLYLKHRSNCLLYFPTQLLYPIQCKLYSGRSAISVGHIVLEL